MATETGRERSALEKVLLVWQSVVDMMMQGKRNREDVLAHLQEIKDDPNFRKKPVVTGQNVKANLREWAKFYKKFFGITLDTRKIHVPAPKDGFNWLIVLAKGLTSEQIYAKCKEHFPCWKYSDNINCISDRSNTDTYAIWVRDRVESDEELKNRSADDLKGDNINCITLPERLILELCYWSKTSGKHLDLQNITLCAGSRYSDGHVPFVFWYDDRLYVNWYCSHSRDDSLRSRQAVS